ncbi:FRG domain-containing protein [Thalassotalea sp. PP2-459]|uniref:FRG domain-containing protein n=1 Tax=Thalassotalea sp. PP2-459 TaxID=1742724 RepID=UPI0009424355|nr:FRG domain-containing protein [Thalassotalea sp. PP2-459]OKY26206.1 FRG domain-containing protein [Thalassotalea sp. PP2-459]
MEIDSVISFLQEIDTHNIAKMFRGQANFDWELLPSLARINHDSLESRYESGWEGIEMDLLNTFKQHAVRYMDKEPKNKLEWMIQAQHHGVPTRLLDWSSNPLKALYFAVENPKYDHVNGSVYVLSLSSWAPTPEKVDADSIITMKAFFPVNINDRIASQEGCFTLFPQRKELKEFKPIKHGFAPETDIVNLSKISIVKEAKADIRKQLNKLGINDLSIFPDLDGIAKSIRRQFDVL